jgi:methylthioribose-1-phosphate isomerase
MNSIEWIHGKVRFIDQTRLPNEEVFVETDDLAVLAEAIRTLKVRGAPALGIAAAYGILLGTQHLRTEDSKEFIAGFEHSASIIAETRPTAKNLFGALERMRSVCRLMINKGVGEIKNALAAEAIAVHREDAEMCAAIGIHGASLVPDPATILTHCNTGSLATGGEGTAQSVITTAFGQGKKISVYADETRPLLQGARLTAWELQKRGIPVTVIVDNTAAFVMARKKIDLVIVGADRIAANGDVANKVGTYNVAVIAKEHGVPFYVAAPGSTIDFAMPDGASIPIEERGAREVTEWFGTRTVPVGVPVYSPAFDVTPHSFITAIVTERGILYPPYERSISAAFPGATRENA